MVKGISGENGEGLGEMEKNRRIKRKRGKS